MTKTIAIFGAGVGGLTVAHELSKLNEYKIDIYEKKNEIGGLARSNRDEDGCAVEICWRVYFDFYHNILKIFSEIPLIEDDKKCVLDNLIVYRHKNITDLKLSKKDELIAIFNIFYGFTSCDERLDKLDYLTWWKALGATSNSNMFREIGGWLGMDRYKGSYKSVIKVGMEMQMLPSYIAKTYNDWVTTKPTSEAWFMHWEALLRKRKVNIHLGTELKSVEIKNNKIISVTIYDHVNKKKSKIIADYYIFSISIEILSRLISKTPELNYGDLKNIKKLKDECLHIQLSVQLFFDRSISLGGNNKNGETNAFLLVDSPWDLIVLLYDKIYSGVKLGKNKNIKGAWSIAACTAYVNGIVYKKPLNKCSYEEIIIEIWAQLMASPELKKIIKENNNFELSEDMIIKWSKLWPCYKFDKEKQIISTTEPKFTNNAGSYDLRPSYKTHITNLFISTAYTKETIDIFSMEAAALSGLLVSKMISKNDSEPYYKERPNLFKPFRTIDKFLYKNDLPNIGPQLIILIIIIIILIIIYSFYKLVK